MQISRSLSLFLACLPLFSLSFAQEIVQQDLVVRNLDRSIDLSSQLCKVSCKIVLENNGKSPVSRFLFALEPKLTGRLSYLAAQSADSSKTQLRVSPVKVKDRGEERFWAVDLKDAVAPGKTTTLEVEYVLIDALAPFPTSILQKEKQLVKYTGNHHVYLPYKVVKQTTTVTLSSRNIETYSKLNPVTQSDSTLTYGPYHQVGPFSYDQMTIHFENNSPFLKVVKLERVIEVSHWGNIAVEETIDLLHTGAYLRGPFSRYEFQRETGSGQSSVKSFKTVLPAAASDVYYRDEIGNISTSHMRMLSDSVEVDLRPRFPLFGGWKTHYVIGYNVPSYEYLYNLGDRYKLKMRLIDHIFDEMVVEKVVTTVILPEGSEKIRLSTPYPVQRLPDGRHSTYLDTKGRPVIAVAKADLVESHIQEFELDYEFPRVLMLQEPLLLVAALYLLFLTVVVWVRLDFSISRDEAGESRLRVGGLVERLLAHADARAATYAQTDDQLAKLKASKNTTAFLQAVKPINSEHRHETTAIAELLTKIKAEAPEMAERVSELQRLDKALKEVYAQKQSLYIDKLVPGHIGRSQFLEAETALNKKKDDAAEKINAIVKTLH